MNPQPNTVQYRQAGVTDVPAMAESRLADPAARPADQRMAAYLEGRHHPQQALGPRVAYVALDAAAVVGYIAGHLTRRHGCDGEVQYLYVAPRHRGTGVATELLRLQAHWFALQHAHKVCVNVDPKNAVARAFYMRHGAIELSRYWLVWTDMSIVCSGAG